MHEQEDSRNGVGKLEQVVGDDSVGARKRRRELARLRVLHAERKIAAVADRLHDRS